MKKVWSMFMLLAVCLVACTNIDDLEDDVRLHHLPTLTIWKMM